MRWFWIDRFTEFVSGKHAEAIKNVSLSEAPVDEYTPGSTVYPSTLIIEGFAQMGGLLVGQVHDFLENVVLAKVNRSEFVFEARPGDTIIMRTEIITLQESGAMVSAVGTINGEVQSRVELMFGFLSSQERFQDFQVFEPAGFSRMLRLLHLFDVGKYEDGTPIELPEHFRRAEVALGVSH